MDGQQSGDSVVLHFRLRIGDQRLEAEAPVPSSPCRAVDLLPAVQALTSGVVAAACRPVEERGGRVSCGPGCGACCRQPVPIAECEAVMLAERVASMPGPRRAAIEERFERAVDTLDRHGLLDRLRAMGELETAERRQALGREYFDLGIACPFLEDESCSIHPFRPLACREYLVTSPASACADPAPEAIEMVPMPARPSVALFRLDGDRIAAEARSLVMVLALDWRRRHPEAGGERRPGPSMFEAFVRGLAGGGS